MDANTPEPLVPDDAGCGGGELDLHFDEYGAPVVQLDPGSEGRLSYVPCSLKALNGSWLLELVPEQFGFPFQVIRGPMRIEASAARFRVSGDVYVLRIGGNAPPNSAELETPMLPGMLIGKNWYPAYPQSQCAEASAIGALIAAGEREIVAVAVVAEKLDVCPPCGGCRQRLAEFAKPDTPVYLGGHETTTLG